MKYLLLAAFLIVAPLSGQQTVVYPDVQIDNIVNVEPTPIEITVMSDSAMIANLNENLEALREQIAAGECNSCGGTSTTTKFALGVVGPLLLWMAISLHRGSKDSPDHHPGERGPVGPAGPPGPQGEPGKDGKDGKDGEDHYGEN